MATDRALRTALLDKLGVQPAALSKRVQKKKRDIPMSTEEATYLIAHEEGLGIDRYLDRDQVDRIRALHTANPNRIPGDTAGSKRKKPAATAAREIRFPGEFKTSNPLLAPAKLNEAVAMAKLYPMLYVLENSIRELIKRVMHDAHGEGWWDNQLTKGKLKNVRKTASDRMRTEKKHSWHQRRGSHPIDYVDIKDLESIILAKKSLFIPDIIPDQAWFEQFMRELYPSRNVLCHMNPLDSDNVHDMCLRARKWEKILTEMKKCLLLCSNCHAELHNPDCIL